MENLDRKLSVAVVGGGYAGFAAAVSLAERGVSVTVFESAPQLGGRARGVGYRDTQLDNGQHLLLGCYRETLRLIEKVGGDIQADFLRLPLQLELHGEFSLRASRLPAPLHLLHALLAARGLSFASRLSAVRFMLALQHMEFRLATDATVTELLARYGQNAELVAKLWEPLCIAALNTPIAKASAQILLNVLRDSLSRTRTDSDMLLPHIDFTALFPERAAGFVMSRNGNVYTSRGVVALQAVDTGMQIFTGDATERFDHVICATSPSAAAKLLHPIAALADTAAILNQLQHQPIYTVYLQYPRHVTLPQPMLGLRDRYAQWLFDKGSIAEQHGLLAAVISAEGLHQNLTQEELAEKIVTELREDLNIIEQPLWTKIIAEKRATFCCAPNLNRPPNSTALPALLLAGDYTAGEYPATLEGAVLSGLKSADLICKQATA